MSVLGNILWILLGGFLLAILWFFAGFLCCVTVVGIPFGLQCFKIAGLVLAPFGKEISYGKMGFGSVLGNILWIVLLRWELAVTALMLGCVFCITVIGIPFGLQHFKFAKLALIPFGAEVDTK